MFHILLYQYIARLVSDMLVYTVYVDQVKTVKYVNTMVEGAIFGEFALVTDKPRSASVCAVTFCEMQELTREDLHELMAAHPDLRLSVTTLAKNIKNRSKTDSRILPKNSGPKISMLGFHIVQRLKGNADRARRTSRSDSLFSEMQQQSTSMSRNGLTPSRTSRSLNAKDVQDAQNRPRLNSINEVGPAPGRIETGLMKIAAVLNFNTSRTDVSSTNSPRTSRPSSRIGSRISSWGKNSPRSAFQAPGKSRLSSDDGAVSAAVHPESAAPPAGSLARTGKQGSRTKPRSWDATSLRSQACAPRV
jgi:CRP-like cAMP-binding protein